MPIITNNSISVKARQDLFPLRVFGCTGRALDRKIDFVKGTIVEVNMALRLKRAGRIGPNNADHLCRGTGGDEKRAIVELHTEVAIVPSAEAGADDPAVAPAGIAQADEDLRFAVVDKSVEPDYGTFEEQARRLLTHLATILPAAEGEQS